MLIIHLKVVHLPLDAPEAFTYTLKPEHQIWCVGEGMSEKRDSDVH